MSFNNTTYVQDETNGVFIKEIGERCISFTLSITLDHSFKLLKLNLATVWTNRQKVNALLASASIMVGDTVQPSISGSSFLTSMPFWAISFQNCSEKREDVISKQWFANSKPDWIGSEWTSNATFCITARTHLMLKHSYSFWTICRIDACSSAWSSGSKKALGVAAIRWGSCTSIEWWHSFPDSSAWASVSTSSFTSCSVSAGRANTVRNRDYGLLQNMRTWALSMSVISN